MTSVPGWRLALPRLRFSPDIPSRVGTHSYKALRQHGPYDNSTLQLRDGSMLFVFPASEQQLAHRLADALLSGVGSFPGFAKFFQVEVPTGDAIKSLRIDTDPSDHQQSSLDYRKAIEQRINEAGYVEPDVAIVLVPRTERFEIQTPYYETKAAFATLGIPTQMVSAELLRDQNQFQWSVANIALQIFAKLGGIPWAVDAPAGEDDLILGIGRSDIARDGGIEHHFGYAVTFVSNGVYKQTWSFTPTADEDEYERRLEAVIGAALAADVDQPPQRLVVHLARQAGRREIEAAERALAGSGLQVGVAYLRLDDSSLYDVADTGQETWAPEKGLVAKLGRRRALLTTEGAGATGPPDGPLLVAMDRRSTIPFEAFDDLIGQVYRLAHANWRGFNAQSKPATLVYGEQLASLVGHLQDVETWNPALLRHELQSRPWFL